jgi:peptidoglycan hydrolase-like protein with peptidoglycan-binding domain
VTSAGTAITDAQTKLTGAEKELADAQTALANAKATASGQSTSSTTPPTTTSTTLVPPATIDRVKQAENDFSTAVQGISDTTPLVEATVEYHSAAFALEIAWLKLLADAGCLTDEQHQQAVEQVTAYTAALQAQLTGAGYYTGDVDGIYGPMTVDAVKKLQSEAGLPTTGVVDRATALALDKKAASSQPAAPQPQSQTAAVQTVLKLTGYWTGPIDGIWTDELTEALMAFQSALGVAPTGTVDAATLEAWQEALEQAKSAAAATTTSAAPATTSATTNTTTASSTTTAPTTSTTAATSSTTSTSASTSTSG